MRRSTMLVSISTVFLMAFIAGMTSAEAQNSVVDVIENSENHTVFEELLEKSDLKKILKENGPYTVLAPTDKAFEEVEDKLESLENDPRRLQNIILAHVYQKEVSAAEVERQRSVTVIEGDIEASNGTVHVIDEVIIK